MEITVNRFVSDRDTTLSAVSVDGKFRCFGLEDEYREEKLVNETRIPAGRYRVSLRREGGFHARYAHKFPDLHRGMLHVQDVPGFEYILIHVGNTDDDTAGCLVVGSGAQAIYGDMSIQRSVDAYRPFYRLVHAAAEAGELWITYVDTDRIQL